MALAGAAWRPGGPSKAEIAGKYEGRVQEARRTRCGRARTAAPRGAVIGTEMRAAVLDLAFAGPAAREATSEAFADNHASNRVSRALGYGPNGTSWSTRRGEAALLTRWRLTRDRWDKTRRTRHRAHRCRGLPARARPVTTRQGTGRNEVFRTRPAGRWISNAGRAERSAVPGSRLDVSVVTQAGHCHRCGRHGPGIWSPNNTFCAQLRGTVNSRFTTQNGGDARLGEDKGRSPNVRRKCAASEIQTADSLRKRRSRRRAPLHRDPHIKTAAETRFLRVVLVPFVCVSLRFDGISSGGSFGCDRAACLRRLLYHKTPRARMDN
jgi:hypothetical protein